MSISEEYGANSFGAKFQTAFIVCFVVFNHTIDWKEVYM